MYLILCVPKLEPVAGVIGGGYAAPRICLIALPGTFLPLPLWLYCFQLYSNELDMDWIAPLLLGLDLASDLFVISSCSVIFSPSFLPNSEVTMPNRPLFFVLLLLSAIYAGSRVKILIKRFAPYNIIFLWQPNSIVGFITVSSVNSCLDLGRKIGWKVVLTILFSARNRHHERDTIERSSSTGGRDCIIDE